MATLRFTRLEHDERHIWLAVVGARGFGRDPASR
jgi:hypothetical protein